MGLSTKYRKLPLWASMVFLVAAMPALAVEPGLHLVGLAMHQETGRNIYLGGIHLDQHVKQYGDLVQASGPKVMEYRVVARRTGVRSLLGGMLLQSEVATGQAPSSASVEFANSIMAVARGSLYAGDSLEILLTEEDATVALLNGQELARVDDGRVSDFLLLGWIAEQGPSMAFRNSLLSGELEPQLLEAYTATRATPERVAQVASWLQPDPLEPVTVAATRIEPVALSAGSLPQVVASVQGAGAATVFEPMLAEGEAVFQSLPATAADVATLHRADAQPLPRLEPAAVGSQVFYQEDAGESPVEPVETGESRALHATGDIGLPAGDDAPAAAVQLAALVPTVDMLASSASGAQAALDFMAYSQRLADFNTQLIGKVYKKIRYPKAAVRRGYQGTLELDVTLRRDGSLVDVEVVSSSGYELLDKAAVRAARVALSDGSLEASDPVAWDEYGAGDDQLVVPVPVSFVLAE